MARRSSPTLRPGVRGDGDDRDVGRRYRGAESFAGIRRNRRCPDDWPSVLRRSKRRTLTLTCRVGEDVATGRLLTATPDGTKLSREEPDARIAHVCEGRGWRGRPPS